MLRSRRTIDAKPVTMNRRAALGLAATLPIAGLAANRAEACSIVVGSPEEQARRLPDLVRLFRAWFERDELAFLGAFHGPRNSNGLSVTDDIMRRYIAAAEDREPARLFAEMFTDPNTIKLLQRIAGIGDRALVAVSEEGTQETPSPCPGVKTLHLFLVGYQINRPSSLRLIESQPWSGYGAQFDWTL